MCVCTRKPSVMLIQKKKLRVSFVNPPYTDSTLLNPTTLFYIKSHYSRFGKYDDQIEWIPFPYKWNLYQSVSEVATELQEADVILFSSYIWNYSICDELASLLSDKILVLGGPHIGTHDYDLMNGRLELYDYICQPTKPGETFMSSLLDNLMEGNLSPKDVTFEIRSKKTDKLSFAVDYSIYEDHFDDLCFLSVYADQHDLEKNISFESTRGCPYQCVFCEWGGGISTKVTKKNLELVERDFIAIRKAGFRFVYLNDANFGMFIERDLKLYELALQHGLMLIDLSTVKIRDLNKRKQLIDACDGLLTQYQVNLSDLNVKAPLPTISIQSISDEAMKVSKRVDLSIQDKIALSEHIDSKKRSERNLELILGMPGSTIDDFYNEFELIWDFAPKGNLDGWKQMRHEYMFLPDSELSNPDYIQKYQIQTVRVSANEHDDIGYKIRSNLYRNRNFEFETISSCYSFTKDQIVEMWIMNKASTYLIKTIYEKYQSSFSIASFMKSAKDILFNCDYMKDVIDYTHTLFDPETSIKSITTYKDGTFIERAIEIRLKTDPLLEAKILQKYLEK
jgi:hypothetical protein